MNLKTKSRLKTEVSKVFQRDSSLYTSPPEEKTSSFTCVSGIRSFPSSLFFTLNVPEDEQIKHVLLTNTVRGVHCFRKKNDSSAANGYLFQFISICYLIWVLGFAGLMLFALIHSFVACPFYAKLFYLTNWQLIAVTAYSNFRALYVVIVRFWGGVPIPQKKKIPFYYLVLMKIVLELHRIAFSFTLYVGFLYLFGQDYDLGIDSILAHFVAPSMMIFDMWFAGMPWPLENVYFVGIFGNLYFTFMAFHWHYKLGHLGSIPATCEPSYQHSLTLQQYYVYQQYQYREDWVLGLNMVGVSVLIPIISFLIYWILREVISKD